MNIKEYMVKKNKNSYGFALIISTIFLEVKLDKSG